VRVHVKFFAIFREMTGIKNEWTEVAEGTTVEGLWKQYASRSPRVGSIRAAYAVNQRLVKPDQVVSDGDEVGFLPPVSGGATAGKRKPTRPATRRKAQSRADTLITRKRLDLEALVKRVAFPGAGAIVTFTGVVRDNARGKSVEHLEYEAYPEMADASLRDIVSEIKERWPEVRVAMAHRVGKLKIGEASLMIAVSSPHRPEAYAASRYAIERVKATLPVWKKEFAADGDHWVEGPVAGELPPEKADAVVREAEYSPF
jgi:molybdopterin converting factor subunit 1